MKNPDFVLLARAMGVHAIQCRSAAELPEKMKEFPEYDGNKPVLMKCMVEKNKHLFPMVRFQPILVHLIRNRTQINVGPCRQGVA